MPNMFNLNEIELCTATFGSDVSRKTVRRSLDLVHGDKPMNRMAKVALLTATILAGGLGLSATTASALTAEEIAAMYSDLYEVVAVVEKADDPSVFEMSVNLDGVEVVVLVDAESGELLPPDQQPTDIALGAEEDEVVDPEERDECKNGAWVDLGFRNQGQCVRFVNTDVDTRPWLHPRDEEASAGDEEADARDACRRGGWEELGYRNQGECIRDN